MVLACAGRVGGGGASGAFRGTRALAMAEPQLNFTMSPNSTVLLFESGECGDRDSVYQFYEYFERLLLGLVALPIIVFGLCANLTSVRIFTHRLMSGNSINWYLAVLSFSDTLILTVCPRPPLRPPLRRPSSSSLCLVAASSSRSGRRTT